MNKVLLNCYKSEFNLEIREKKIDLNLVNPKYNQNKVLEFLACVLPISKQLNSYKTHTLTKKKLGSEDYSAPEIKYKGIYNEKSDMYSLGCIIYELFTLSEYFIDQKECKINTDI